MARSFLAISALALLAIVPAVAKPRAHGLICVPVYIEGAGPVWICARHAR